MPRKKTILTAEDVKAQMAELTKETPKKRTTKKSDTKKSDTKKKTTKDSEKSKKKTAVKKATIKKVSAKEQKIIDWLDKMNIHNYTINEDMSIDVTGFCNMRGMLKGDLPDYIQFGTIYPHPTFKTTDFDISDSPIKSLRGCPHTVYGNFKCHNTKVSSLEYAPKVVKSTFVFYENPLEAEDFMIEDVCEAKFVQTYKTYIWNPKDWCPEAKKTTKKSTKKAVSDETEEKPKRTRKSSKKTE